MIYISEIKLTELVNNFCEEIERQKKLAENFSKQCTELELKLSHFMTDEELSFMNANPKLRLELTEENQQLKKILRDIRNINSHGNMEYFGEAVMEF